MAFETLINCDKIAFISEGISFFLNFNCSMKQQIVRKVYI